MALVVHHVWLLRRLPYIETVWRELFKKNTIDKKSSKSLIAIPLLFDDLNSNKRGSPLLRRLGNKNVKSFWCTTSHHSIICIYLHLCIAFTFFQIPIVVRHHNTIAAVIFLWRWWWWERYYNSLVGRWKIITFVIWKRLLIISLYGNK